MTSSSFKMNLYKRQDQQEHCFSLQKTLSFTQQELPSYFHPPLMLQKIRQRLVNYAKKQHGFVKHQFTATNLLGFTNFMAKCLISRQKVTLSTQIFLRPLDLYIIWSTLFFLFDILLSLVIRRVSYLLNRSWYVSFSGYISHPLSPLWYFKVPFCFTSLNLIFFIYSFSCSETRTYLPWFAGIR